MCLGVGGVRLDRAVSVQLLEAVAPNAIDIAIEAANRAGQVDEEQKRALALALEEARYEVVLAERRHAAVDPDKRLVARELEARWEAALGRVRELEQREKDLQASVAARPRPNVAALKRLAEDLPRVWNAPSADAALKQRIVRTLIREVVISKGDSPKVIIASIHWVGGRHTPVRIARVDSRPHPKDRPSAVDAIRKLGGRWSDQQVAIALNRMRCSAEDGSTSWTITRVRTLRERLGLPAPQSSSQSEHISIREAAARLGIHLSSVHRLIRAGTLPATQCMRQAPWEVPAAALDTEAVRIGVREIVARRPRKSTRMQDDRTLRLPGL
jgi:excisionase family DNA binding protein